MFERFLEISLLCNTEISEDIWNAHRHLKHLYQPTNQVSK